MLELHGAWPEALVEARRACDRLAAPVNPAALGGACMIEGDLLRLVGDFDGAETVYRARQRVRTGPTAQPRPAPTRSRPGRRRRRDDPTRASAKPKTRCRALACSPPTSRSCSRPATPPPPARQPTSSVCWRRNSQRRTCVPTPTGHAAQCSWPKGTPTPRSSNCERPSTSSTPLACATRPHAPGCSSPTRAQRSATTTRPPWKRAPPVPCSTPSARPRPWNRSPSPRHRHPMA